MTRQMPTLVMNYIPQSEKFSSMVARRETVWYWIIFGLGLFWTLFLCLNSPGVYLHDEIGHFLISQNAWNYPELILDVWGRPINTMLYMVPAPLGLSFARLLSLFMAGLTVWLTTRVAKKSGVERLCLIPLMLWFQPWFNDFSYQVITEVPLSLGMIAGTFLWLKGRENVAAVLFGLLPLIRHEGIALSVAYCFFMFYRRKWSAGLLTILPLTGYNLLYFAALHDWPFRIFFNAQLTDQYGSGSWFHYVPRLVYRAGLPVMVLAITALTIVWKQRERFLYLAIYSIYFLLHVIIFRFGLFASGGYTIFLLPLAPALAIIAALGGERLLNYLKELQSSTGILSSRRLRYALICTGAAFILSTGFISRPNPVDEDGLAMQEAAQWIREKGYSKEHITSCHVWFVYYYNLPWTPDGRWDTPVDLVALPNESLVIWDRHYSEQWGINLNYLSDAHNGWKKLKDFCDGIAILFQKDTNSVENK